MKRYTNIAGTARKITLRTASQNRNCVGLPGNAVMVAEYQDKDCKSARIKNEPRQKPKGGCKTPNRLPLQQLNHLFSSLSLFTILNL